MANIVYRSINMWIENKLELAMWSSLIFLEKQFWRNGIGKNLSEAVLRKNWKTEIEKQRVNTCVSFATKEYKN